MRKAKDAVLPQAIKQAIKARTLYGALLLLLLAAPVAAEQSLTAFQCGLYNNSFKQNRKQLQEQKDAEKDACSQKIDQINNTFAWFKHCEADINDRYRPAFQKLDAEEKQFMDKAQNCKAMADQKLKDQERLAKQQQETN
ncbi:MAG: hypothetical protein REI12_14115, partial [Pedobacter sp.]|nr:hypothetical protein [Pedobacter sp.]